MADAKGYRTVIIAMDGSDYAQNAFDWYLRNLRRDSDNLILVHASEFHTVVQSPLEISDLTTLTNLYEEEEQVTKEFVDKLTALLKEKHSNGMVKAINGRPGEIIIKVAEDEDADMIITGSRGMGTVRRTILGSVSDYIIHHSTVPIVVWKK